MGTGDDHAAALPFRAAAAGMGVNAGLAAVKVAAGLLAGSSAVLADGIDSALDVLVGLAAAVGIAVAARPPDPEHPYGHRRAEAVATALLGLLVLGAGLALLHGTYRQLTAPPLGVPGTVAAVAAGLSLVAKLALARHHLVLGHSLGSPALVAAGLNYRADALVSGGALAGAVGARVGLPWLDPLAASGISLVVLRTGWTLGRQAVDEFMDRSADPRTVGRLRRLIETVSGVEAVHELRTRASGGRLLVDVKIGVRPDLTVEAGHAVASSVKDELLARVPEALDVMVHVNPQLRETPPRAPAYRPEPEP